MLKLNKGKYMYSVYENKDKDSWCIIDENMMVDELTYRYTLTDLPQDSVSQKMIIWYYVDPQTKEKTLNKVPLSKESAILYWTSQREQGFTTRSNATNMINKINNESDSRYIFLYDAYPEYKDLINNFIFATAVICHEKNVKRDVGSRYMQTINTFLKFIEAENYKVKSLMDLSIKFQEDLLVYMESENDYFKQQYDRRNMIEMLNFILNNANMENVINSKIFIVKSKKRNQKSRTDISQEIVVQLLAGAVKDIKDYINKIKELEEWRRIYNGKKFDSLENIANAYWNYPEYFNDYEKENSRNSAIAAHRKRFNIMAITNYNVDLNNLSKQEIFQLSQNGYNINDFLNPFIMAWFFDDILIKFPLNKGDKYVYTATPLNEYTRYQIKTPVMQYIKPYGKSSLPYKKVFDDILARKYPTSNEIFPFLLYWMIQTGANTEAIFNIKNKEIIDSIEYEIGDYFIEQDTAIIKSFKNRGTGDWYFFSLDKKEKNGLYSYLKFLKQILKPLWEYQQNDIFWVYTASKNIAHGKIIHEFNRYTAKDSLKLFIKKHNILNESGKEVQNIKLTQLRNSFITMMDLKDLNIEEIQELIRHDKFDTRFQYYNNSKDLQHRNFIAINAIQESIIEDAKNFQGSIHHNAIKLNKMKKYEEVYLGKCSNINDPEYPGSRVLNENEICTDWDNCLQCKNSQIYKEHLPKICLRIKQYEQMKSIMTVFEWENNFKVKYDVANDALKKWIKTGGKQEHIDDAWKLVEANKVFLPNIFPTGSMQINKVI